MHIDCDLRDSAYDALELIKEYLNNKKTIFILFDDWGVHQNEIPDGFYKWVNENQENIVSITRQYLQQTTQDILD